MVFNPSTSIINRLKILNKSHSQIMNPSKQMNIRLEQFFEKKIKKPKKKKPTNIYIKSFEDDQSLCS